MIIKPESAMSEMATGKDSESVPSMSYTQIFIRPILMLSFKLLRILISSFLITGYPTKVLYEFMIPPDLEPEDFSPNSHT